jgi:quercetin dioxygenase-like cupin family protein
MPGEGETHDSGGATLTIKAGGAETGGTFFMSEITIPPGYPGPPLHRHAQLCDMFYVLEGTLTLRVDGETVLLPAGGFACAPPGVIHTFSNPGDQRVRMLNFSTPSGFEFYMRDLAAAFSGGAMPTSAQIGAIASRYDVEVVPEG